MDNSAETNLPKNFILIDKPVTWTSFDAVNFIRTKLRAAKPENRNIKVGHAGTLDPFATGLLIIGIGRDATKDLDTFKNLPKKYLATVRLGATSDTDDPTGNVVENKCTPIELDKIQTALKKFIGEQMQIPPAHSAKKINGRRAYKFARAGKDPELKPQPIEIYDIKLLEYAWPNLKIEVSCAAGTYIRALARDLGVELGCGAYCLALTRIAIGNHTIVDAHPLTDILSFLATYTD